MPNKVSLPLLFMKIGKLLYVKTRVAWRKWLEKNHAKKKEIWLLYYKKHTGKLRIPYDDAVEEALCFGWIDSTVKRIDDARFAQRFTPRRKGSPVSLMNQERIRKLLPQNKMMPAGVATLSPSFHSEKFVIPKDILREIKKNAAAWKHFQQFPESYCRIRIAYIESQRQHDSIAFQKALQNFIRQTAKNKRFGMMKS